MSTTVASLARFEIAAAMIGATQAMVGVVLGGIWPRWAIMWTIAIGVFVIAKWLSWLPARNLRASSKQVAAYFLAWPGLDAVAFVAERQAVHSPRPLEWIFACAKTLFGLLLVAIGASISHSADPLLVGWIGMIGVVFTLHFGLFHLLSCFWRARGVNAAPLMDWPILAASVSVFWGKRWNRAFRDLTHRFVFRPLTSRFDLALGSVLAFLFSGLIHELAITVPAGGGYGGPTIYFFIQGIGLLWERSKAGRWMGLGSGWRGRLFAGAVLVAPLGLLFPRVFVVEVVVPFLQALRSIS